MTKVHAVLLIDHQHARLMGLDSAPVEVQKLKTHTHHTRQHGSQVRTEHEFFGEVCDALNGIKEVLVTGSHQAQADFRHYVEKHRGHISPQIVGWETVDHPTDGQLAALAKKFFDKYERMAGRPA
jgi:stalled ribosome rescue protein Dom34